MGEQLVFIIQGFGLVLVVLALLWLLSAVLGRFFIAREQRAAARTTAPAPPAVGAEIGRASCRERVCHRV